MALREKFGRLVLLDESEASGLGREYRAARLGPSGLDRLVSVLCFAPAVSTHGPATKRLMEEARLAARLQNPGLLRVLGIGRVEQTFYVSTELVEGRTLAAILGRCSHDSFPFAADHALMVASRTASALEYLHGKKDDAGRQLFHGLLGPSRLVVAFDGEVKVKGLGLWAALRETGLLPDADRAFLAPEQRAGAGEPRSDVYSLGLVLLASLTGAPPSDDPLASLPSARIVNVTGEPSPLPKPLHDLLTRALAREPAGRFATIAEMRKAIDTLLFSGDFTPTTFDLAFFMHTLFRDDMERESKEIDEARRADYREFLEEKPATAVAPAPAVAPPPAVAAAAPEAAVATLLVPPAAPADLARTQALQAAEAVATTILAPVELPATVVTAPLPVENDAVTLPPAPAPRHVEPARPERATTPAPGRVEPAAPEPPRSDEKPVHAPESHREPAPRPAREVRDIAPRLGLEPAEAERSSGKGLWIALGLVAVVALAAGGFFFLRSRGSTTPTTTTLSPDVVAAMTRVKELEQRIQQMERERAEAENTAAEEARKKLEAQAAARGRAVDPSALAKAQEDARQKARAEQERRQHEELARLAEARREEERRIAEATPPPTTAPPALATPEAAAPVLPTPEALTPVTTTTVPGAAAAQPQATVTDAGTAPPAAEVTAKIVPPTLVSQVQPLYPPIAQMRRLAGTVELTATVDETGKVIEARVVKATPARMGFEESALRAARQRKYRPATRDGVPIRMVVPIVMIFKQ